MHNPSARKQKLLHGSYINDPLDDSKINVGTVQQRIAGVLQPWLRVVALATITPDEELYMNYGKEHWINRSNFSSIPKEIQNICCKYYDFKKNEVVSMPTPSSSSPEAAGQKNKKRTKKN